MSLETPNDKVVVTTCGEEVLSSSAIDLSQLQPCSHEEADYRMMLHVHHGFQQQHRRVMVHATDTDVVILCISTASVLSGCEVWVAFGHGKHLRYIRTHAIADKLGPDKCWRLLLLHAISGCDTVSAFSGICKKTVHP